jgi:cephalosporin-C deacetylase-like acetyl esterase
MERRSEGDAPSVAAVAAGVAHHPGDPFAYDERVPLDPRVSRRAVTGRVTIERLTYAAADGERVPAVLTSPAHGAPPFPCVMLGHGLRGSKDGFPIADMLAMGGLASFAIDARLHGERADWQALRHLDRDPRVLERMLRETVVDMRRGLDYLGTRTDCDPGRIGYLGISMGGFLGAMLGGSDARVMAPVLLVSGADWPTMLESSEARDYRGLPENVLADAAAVLDPIDPKHWVGRISPRPVLMIAGDADEAVPPASARALHAAAREPKQVVWYRGGHGFPSGAEQTRILGLIASWLMEHLASD